MLIPILLPPNGHLAWAHAGEIADAFKAAGKANPITVAGVANAFAESWWSANAVGDHGQSYGPWQLKKQFYQALILAGTGIDICSPATTLTQHVTAVLFALSTPANAKTLAALDAATTGVDATRIWAADFERASAGGAVDRRVAIAPAIEVWLAGHISVKTLGIA